MDPASLLQQLAPLREPEPVHWWPLAPGWWLLGVLVLLGLAVVFWWVWQRWQSNRYRRDALRQLKRLCSEREPTLEQVNILLKATALRGWPRDQVAALNGEAWLRLLTDSCPDLQPECLVSLESVYQTPSDPASPLLLDGVSRWIRRHNISLSGASP